MKYVSTRGEAAPVDFVTACLTGLAPDGGLYVPEAWPQIAPATPDEDYVSLATRILSAFAGPAMSAPTLGAICRDAYSTFDHKAMTPLVQTGPDQWMLELHHGPTLAFKDVAMQFIGRFYDHVLTERDERMTVMCATSGDTGGAAAAAFAGSARVDLVILHPHGRISPVQRRFMTSTGAVNVHNLALDGDFDACQAIVKALFADTPFVNDVSLSGVNSINWARIAAQTVYYAAVQAALGPERAIRFIVPSGNMGDALAGYVAARCGLVPDFAAVCAVNANRTLADLLDTGRMVRTDARETPSPAMDISVPSNFERLLFELSGRDSAEVRRFYARFAQSGASDLSDTAKANLPETGLTALAVHDQATHEEMVRTLGETGWLVCPHTAVGLSAARSLVSPGRTTVTLATAHAAKFPETVLAATGRNAPLPQRCAQTVSQPEVFEPMPADLEMVRSRVLSIAKAAC